jgi:FOG: cheY-like receiver
MKKILVIDDSPTIYGVIEQIIVNNPVLKEQVQVSFSSNGFDGLVKISEIHPDLIFIDSEMPELNGFQTITLIRNNDACIDTPIVYLSEDDSLFTKVYSQMYGANVFLSKANLKKEQIQNIIHNHLFLE